MAWPFAPTGVGGFAGTRNGFTGSSGGGRGFDAGADAGADAAETGGAADIGGGLGAP
jgi:hypothetical protein